MTAAVAQALKMLYCYAPEDRQWPTIIDAQLSDLKRQHQIISRFDGELVQTPDQKAHLLTLIQDRDMVLLLVSPHFQAVESFWQELCQELRKNIYWPALLAECRLVAFILEPVAGNHAPALAREILPREGVPPRAEQEPEPRQPLETVPNGAKPLSLWSNQEQAFEQTAQWLRVTIERLWLARGEYHAFEEMGEMAEEALAAYNEALRLNPLLKDAWHGKAVSLLYLREREEALEKAACRKKDAQSDKDYTSIGPQLDEEAILASEEALRLDPAYLWAWQTKASALAGLKRYEEALQAYGEFLQGHPTHADVWHEKSKILKALGRKREARQAEKTARQLGWRW
jgi:tetratricopeptide (TPR) repeat protein